MRDFLFLILLISLGISCKTNKIATFKKTNEKYLSSLVSGNFKTNDKIEFQVLCFNKYDKDDRSGKKVLVDKEYVIKELNNLYLLKNRNVGFRVYNDTVYYFKERKEIREGRLKESESLYQTNPQANKNQTNSTILCNVIDRLEKQELKYSLSNKKIDSIMQLPNGYKYLDKSGLDIFIKEHIADLLNRINE